MAVSTVSSNNSSWEAWNLTTASTTMASTITPMNHQSTATRMSELTSETTSSTESTTSSIRALVYQKMGHKTDRGSNRALDKKSFLLLPAMLQHYPHENSTAASGGFLEGKPSFSDPGSFYRGHYILAAGLAVGVVVFVMLLVCHQKKGLRAGYQKLLTLRGAKSRSGNLDYIYRPLQGDVRDEDYENTFVGVSVPLLQDVTKL